MISRVPRGVLVSAAVLGPLLLSYLAYSRPWLFTSQTYLGGLLVLEFLVAAVWMYRQVFFPLVLVAFLLAGVELPVASFWTAVRWLFLCVGALVGCVMVLKEHRLRFGLFDAVGLFAVLAAFVSAAPGVSRYPGIALLKALSLLLLFAYSATGARLAIMGRESLFFTWLLRGCEILVAATAVSYLVLGLEVMGNPNSLGAVMGVAAAPLLLWGTLVAFDTFTRSRRMLMYAICMYLTYYSHARAGMVAALVSCGLLCVTLRKYGFLMQGVGVIVILGATAAIVQPEAFSNTLSSVTSTVVYKGGARENSFLASRESPWQDALDSIRDHPWFGTGFGTADNGTNVSEHLGEFSSVRGASAEFGNSYLAVASWVGMLGVLPFFLLVLMLLGKVVHIIRWTLQTGDSSNPAVPLAMVLLAGMIHAGLEDWLFAPGYYLCVLFWCLAFTFVDLARSPVVALRPAFLGSRPRPMNQKLSSIAPSR